MDASFDFETSSDEVIVRQSPEEEGKSNRLEGGGDFSYSSSQSAKQSLDVTPPPYENNFYPSSFSTPIQQAKEESQRPRSRPRSAPDAFGESFATSGIISAFSGPTPPKRQASFSFSSLSPQQAAKEDKSFKLGSNVTPSSSNYFGSDMFPNATQQGGEVNQSRPFKADEGEIWAPWSATATPKTTPTPSPKKRVSFCLSPEQEARCQSPKSRISLDLGLDDGVLEIGQPLFNSSVLWNELEEHNLTLDSLDSSQLRSTLEEVLQQNSSLRQEVENKSRQIQTAKLQMKALIDLDLSSVEPVLGGNRSNNSVGDPDASSGRSNGGNGAVPKSPSILTSMTSDNASEIQERHPESNDDNNIAPRIRNNYPIPGILPEHTFIFIREMTSRIEVHQVRDRIVEGLHFSNQLIVGGVTGWGVAYLVKNFGKTALTAVGGGALILTFATRNGFVEVNWNRVIVELQKRGGNPHHHSDSRISTENGRDRDRGDESFGSGAGGTEESDLSVEGAEDWTVEKILKAKKWITEHSVVTAGFVTGFFYSLF